MWYAKDNTMPRGHGQPHPMVNRVSIAGIPIVILLKETRLGGRATKRGDARRDFGYERHCPPHK